MTNFRLQAVDPATLTGDDVAALSELAEAVSDGGAVSFRVTPLLPLPDYLRLIKRDAIGVLATEAGSGRPVGAAWLDFGEFTFAGRPARYALLNALQVHPDFRRRGIAAALTEWRLARAEQAGQPEQAEQTERPAVRDADRADSATRLPIVPIATIQHGNTASLGNARRWATTISPPLTVTPIPMRRRRPQRKHDWTIREARSADLQTVAAGLAASRSGFAMGPAAGTEPLRRWLGHRLDGRPLNRYLVIVGPNGRPLAGLGLHDQPRYSHMQVTGLNPVLRWAGRLAGVVPASGTMRNVGAVLPWCAPGAETAGRLLWQEMLHRERERGTSIVTTVDPRHPARSMIAGARWLPTTSILVASRPPAGLEPVAGPVELPL